MTETVHKKPLLKKAYGSIPHLPTSRLGPGDHFITFGQADILTTKPRDRHDVIIVQEKLDGSCVVVANHDGLHYPLMRAGWEAMSSPHVQHHMFHRWVVANFSRFKALDLQPGERVAGEWLAMAHGIKYDLTGRDPFVAFDIIRGGTRVPFEEFKFRIDKAGLTRAPVLSTDCAVSLACALVFLGERGHYGAQEKAEGVVYRCERRGVFDFIAKYVHHDKIDGKYFTDETWNWRE